MDDLTLEDIKAALGKAYNIDNINVATKPNPLSTYVPGTEIAPHELTLEDIQNALGQAFSPDAANAPPESQGNKHFGHLLQKAFEMKQGFLPAVGTGAQTAAGVLSGMATPIVGGVYGIAKSIPEAIQTGQAPQPIAQKYSEEFIRQHPGFKVTDPQAQANLEAIQKGFEATKLPPIMPEGLQMSTSGATPKEMLMATKANLPKISIQKSGAETQLANQFAQRGQNIGAAQTTAPAMLRGNIDAAIADASPELQAHINSHPPENVNVPAVQTRALEEKHGVNLLTSQRTGDMPTYRKAWNERTANGLEEDFKSQPQQLYDAFEQSKQRHAPDISSQADASELGQHEINGLVETDKARLANIDKNYKDFRNAYIKFKQDAGLPVENDFPVNGKEFLSNANKALINESLQFDIPESIQKLLNSIDENNGQMSYQEFLNLDKRLSAKQREGTGSEKEAAKVIRKELNNIPLENEAAILQPQYEKAKASAKERFDVIDSNPAYKAAIDAAEDAKHSPDAISLKAKDFHKTYVSSGNPELIRRMKTELPVDHIAHQAMTWGELERAKQAITNASASRVNAETFAKFLRDSKSGLREALPPAAMQDVSEIGLLNSKMVKPDAGAFNYSNSYTNLFADLARQGLLNAGELKLMTATGGASVPVVSGAKSLLQKFNKDAFANEQRNSFGGLTKE
jgi:hypothetical protein